MEIYREIQGTGFNWGNYNHPLYLKLSDEKKLASISSQINQLQNAQELIEEYEQLYNACKNSTEQPAKASK